MKHLSVTLSVLMIVLGTIMAGFSYWFAQQQENNYDKSNQNLTDAKQTYTQAQNKSHWIARYKQSFDLLVKNRVIGDGDRLGWIETLDQIAQIEKIPYLKFTLNKLEPATFIFYQQEMTGLSLFKTKMELKFSLLHEGDLFALLRSLESRGQGLFLVDSCSLINQIKNESELFQEIDYHQELKDINKNIYRHNINGSCYLNWYTIHEAETVDENPPPPM